MRWMPTPCTFFHVVAVIFGQIARNHSHNVAEPDATPLHRRNRQRTPARPLKRLLVPAARLSAPTETSGEVSFRGSRALGPPDKRRFQAASGRGRSSAERIQDRRSLLVVEAIGRFESDLGLLEPGKSPGSQP